MRLKFGASMPPDSVLLADQWLEYTGSALTQNFNIAPYVGQGYDTVDVYCVGGGGSGGSGGGCNTSQTISAGGGGGGGGGGNVAYAIGLALESLPGTVPIYVAPSQPGAAAPASGPNRGNPGLAGHSTIFGYGFTPAIIHAYGGGGGGGGGAGGTGAFPGNGGGGGAGAGLTDFGANGGNGSSTAAGLPGVGQEGSASGGEGGRYYVTPQFLGQDGYDNNLLIVDYGDGINYAYNAAGGGGGGHGYSVANTPTGNNTTVAGHGGYGLGTDGSPMVGGHQNGPVNGHGNGRSGSGGGGGGGVNLQYLTGHKVASTAYGRGGQGGIGQLIPGTAGPSTAGIYGLSGVCLIRVYKKAS